MAKSGQPAFEAWHAYVSSGRLDAPLLRPAVFRAWERSHQAGADPQRMRAEVLSNSDAERVIDANADLVAAAQPYLRALSRAAGRERHAAMLGDAQAILLDVQGDAATVHGPERVPGIGSFLSEAHAGANGIGTPLAHQGYVELAGPEHFIGGFHLFTCQGLPLRGFEGETIGSLSVSVRTPLAADRLRRVLKVAARGIEADMIVQGLRRRLRRLPRDAAWPQFECLHQDLVQLHTASRLEFELASFESARVSGDAHVLLRDANELIERFTRLSRLWRVLVDPTVCVGDELEADQLIRDSVDLVQTEARLAKVTLRASTLPCGRIRDVHEAVPALVAGHFVALSRAGEGTVVEVSLDERRRVQWRLLPLTGRPHSFHCNLEVVGT
jgi:transcriptional regulator of acetoin/glycerol metabolism